MNRSIVSFLHDYNIGDDTYLFAISNKFFDIFQMQAESSGKEPTQSVQTFGRKKTATAVAYCKRGQGIIRVNGKPLEQVEPKPLQFKLQEPLLLLGKDRFSEVDIRIRVKGGGRIAQIYDIQHAQRIRDQLRLLVSIIQFQSKSGIFGPDFTTGSLERKNH